MNQQAYIDGYLGKQAFKDPVTGDDRSILGEIALHIPSPASIPINAARYARRAYKWGEHVWNKDPNPQPYTGQHDSKFTGSLAKPFLKGTPYEFMGDKYTPTNNTMSFWERIAPKGVEDMYASHIGNRIKAEAAAGQFSEDTKQRYRTDPRVRGPMQEQAWNMAKDKMKSTAMKAAPWLLGGGGLIMLMSMLFRKKQQGAPPQQISAIQAQIQRLQQQQKPMRLNLVGNR